MKFLFLCMTMCLSLSAFGQISKNAVDSLDKQYQQNLGGGKSPYACALQYYNEMDSLLNVVYNQLVTTMNDPQRESLQISQEQWTEKKEAYFKEIDIRVEKKRPMTLAGLDDDMIVTDNKAAYIKNRVMELLAKEQHS